MGRVSDAMKRAGQPGTPLDPDVGAGSFPVGEDEPAIPSGAPPPPDEPERWVAPPAQLVRRDQRHAIRVHPSQRTGDGDIRFIDAVGVLVRRRWLIAGIVSSLVMAALAYNLLAARTYQARSRLLVEPTSPNPIPLRDVAEDQGRLDYYLTQLEILRSRALARRTLENLKLLDQNPARQDGQVRRLLAGLSVSPVQSTMGDSRVINVTVKSNDPALSARLADGIAQTYVEQNLETRRQGSRDASEWLNQRLAELRVEVSKREVALQNYREQKESVSLGEDQNNITMQKLAQLNSLVTNARTDRLEKQALFDQLRAIRAKGQPLDTFTPILQNSFIQGLKADLAGLQRDRERLAQQLGDKHPDMVKINNSIESATRRLNDEMAKIVSGVENDFRTADAKESSLDRALEEQKREVLRLNQASIGYATLQRDASSTQQMFQTVLQRMKEMDLAAELQSNNARILDHAEVPTVPIWPRTRLNLVIAFFGGLFVAMMTALGLDYLKPRIAIPSDIPGLLNLPLLGVTPRIRGLKQRIAHHDLPVAFQEALRDIRTQLFLSPIRGAARSLTVTSTASGEGKTMVATNLAMSIAMTGRRVLLVDADMRRPQVHNIFTGISRSPGLSDVMQGKQKPMDVLVDGPVKGLVLMPAGVPVANPTDLLDSGRLSHLVQGFSHVFDTVILDCPPIQGVADAAIVANTTASVLFVIGSGRTSPEAAQAALERMAAIQAQVVGVVLNKAQLDPRESYGYVQPEIVR